jgi:hypothetical protein
MELVNAPTELSFAARAVPLLSVLPNSLRYVFHLSLSRTLSRTL